MHLRREQFALQRVQLCVHPLRQAYGIGSRLLGDIQCHHGVTRRGLSICRAVSGKTDPGVARRFLRSVHNPRNIAQIHRHTIDHIYNQPGQLVGAAQRISAFQQNRRVVEGPAACGLQVVGCPQGRAHFGRTGAPRGQAFRVQQYLHLTGTAAGYRHFTGVWQALQPCTQFIRHATQIVIAIALRSLGPQCEHQDRDVIDLHRTQVPAADNGGQQLRIGVKLVIGVQQGFFTILTDIERQCGYRTPGSCCGVHMFDPRNLRQQLFQRDRHLPLHLPGGQPGRLDKHIHHRHYDLRFFLTRR